MEFKKVHPSTIKKKVLKFSFESSLGQDVLITLYIAELVFLFVPIKDFDILPFEVILVCSFCLLFSNVFDFIRLIKTS